MFMVHFGPFCMTSTGKKQRPTCLLQGNLRKRTEKSRTLTVFQVVPSTSRDCRTQPNSGNRDRKRDFVTSVDGFWFSGLLKSHPGSPLLKMFQ